MEQISAYFRNQIKFKILFSILLNYAKFQLLTTFSQFSDSALPKYNHIS